jgi:hypothetical protein
MKNLQNIAATLVMAGIMIGLISCREDPEPLIPNRTHLGVNGEILADHVSFFINDRDASNIEESFMNGKGFLDKDNTTRISASLKHVTYYETEHSVQIECGEFTCSDEDGDRFFGEYCGCGDYGDGNVCVEMVLNITGGSGKYIGANGSISATVNRDVDDENSDHILNLKGLILLPAK